MRMNKKTLEALHGSVKNWTSKIGSRICFSIWKVSSAPINS